MRGLLRVVSDMPSYLVKPERDVDFYVLWSTVTESPHAWGTAEWFRSEETELDGWGNRHRPLTRRLESADLNGTSALEPKGENPFYGWADDGFVYRQLGILPRANLPELCRRLDLEADPDVSDLLEPFED